MSTKEQVSLPARPALPAQPAQPARPARPALVPNEGRMFRWSAPEGWRASESTAGVDLTSPDGQTTVSSLSQYGAPHAASGRAMVDAVIAMVNPTLRITSARSHGDVPIAGGQWAVDEFELTGRSKAGAPVTVGITTYASKGYTPMAVLLMQQAPSAGWERDKLWLPAVAASIELTDTSGSFLGANTRLLPRNNPLDNSGLIESWRQKGISDDRISQMQREGTMGYERRVDPQTGRMYDMPLELYDGTVGGYRNPARPNEILQPVPRPR